jgi:hypothetical protein
MLHLDPRAEDVLACGLLDAYADAEAPQSRRQRGVWDDDFPRGQLLCDAHAVAFAAVV